MNKILYSKHSIRLLSTINKTFKACDIVFTPSIIHKSIPDVSKLVFGKNITDHMLVVHWNDTVGWKLPEIKAYAELPMYPSISALHYGCSVFEGLKAYKVPDGISIYRPLLHMERLRRSAKRMCLPEFDERELLKCIIKLIEIEKRWVPDSNVASLYIRPILFSTEPTLKVKPSESASLYVLLCPVGPYWASGGVKPVSLLADPSLIRSWPGGTGNIKTGCNYGPTLFSQAAAEKEGCSQVLWLFDGKISEAGTMNFFVYWINEKGERELATPLLTDGTVLAGITRRSIVELVKEWGINMVERDIKMSDFIEGCKNKKVLECFGSGTACIISPIGKVKYEGEFIEIPMRAEEPKLYERILNNISDIQRNRVKTNWNTIISEK